MGERLGGRLAAGQGEPTTHIHIIEPLALKNFPENKDNEVDKRERCLILKIIEKLRHRNIAYFVELHKASTKGDPAQRSGFSRMALQAPDHLPSHIRTEEFNEKCCFPVFLPASWHFILQAVSRNMH